MLDRDERIRADERRERELRVWSAPQYGIRNGRFCAVDGDGPYKRKMPRQRSDHDNPLFRDPPAS